MSNPYDIFAQRVLGEAQYTPEERFRELFMIGGDKMSQYRPAVVKQARIIWDYLVQKEIAQFGELWKGRYNIKDRNMSLDKVYQIALDAWKQGKIKVDTSVGSRDDR